MITKQQKLSGFTLVEVQIAVVILVLIATVLAGTLNLLNKSNKANDALIAHITSFRAVSQLLQQQFSSLAPFSVINGNQQNVLFQGDENSIYFMGYLPENVINGGPFLLKLYSNDDQLWLGFKPLDNSQSFEQNKASEFEKVSLLSSLKAFEIEYGNDGNWQTKWQSQQILPSQIKLSIQQKSEKWPELIIPIRSYSAVNLPIHKIMIINKSLSQSGS